MRRIAILLSLLIVGSIVLMLAAGGLENPHEESHDGRAARVKRVGMVIGLKPEFIDEYRRLHGKDQAGVRDLLNKYHLHNFNIFLQPMPDGKWYEFGYYEYTGDDFDADMAKLAKEPRNVAWLEICDPMQNPLPGATGWTEMKPVYFNP